MLKTVYSSALSIQARYERLCRDLCSRTSDLVKKAFSEANSAMACVNGVVSGTGSTLVRNDQKLL